MRIMGICTECRRTRHVTVRGISPRAVQTGVCSQCEDKERKARAERIAAQQARSTPVPPIAVAEGDRVELIAMPNDPAPIEPGARGTVTFVNTDAPGNAQVGVEWDSGRTLMLLHGVDHYRRLSSSAEKSR